MAKNIKKHNFDIKNFLSKKNLYIHKKFLRIDRLNFLKNLILKKKRLRVLEFGTGISTLIIAKSLSLNKSKFYNKIKDFREENFISYSIDNNKKFLNISKKNINNLKLNKICKFLFVNLQMEIYNGIISSSCNILPNINPDLIILDGPDQKLIKGKSNNINFKDKSLHRYKMIF